MTLTSRVELMIYLGWSLNLPIVLKKKKKVLSGLLCKKRKVKMQEGKVLPPV